MRQLGFAIAIAWVVGLVGCSGSTTGDGQSQGGGGLFGSSTPASSSSGTSSTSHGGSSGGSKTAACGVTTGIAACDACLDQKCCSQAKACSGNADCLGLSRCASQCSANDDACVQSCTSQYPNGRTDLQAALACANDSCPTECQ